MIHFGNVYTLQSIVSAVDPGFYDLSLALGVWDAVHQGHFITGQGVRLRWSAVHSLLKVVSGFEAEEA